MVVVLRYQRALICQYFLFSKGPTSMPFHTRTCDMSGFLGGTLRQDYGSKWKRETKVKETLLLLLNTINYPWRALTAFCQETTYQMKTGPRPVYVFVFCDSWFFPLLSVFSFSPSTVFPFIVILQWFSARVSWHPGVLWDPLKGAVNHHSILAPGVFGNIISCKLQICICPKYHQLAL